MGHNILFYRDFLPVVRERHREVKVRLASQNRTGRMDGEMDYAKDKVRKTDGLRRFSRSRRQNGSGAETNCWFLGRIR